MTLTRDFKQTIVERNNASQPLHGPCWTRPRRCSSMATRQRPARSCAIWSTPPWASRGWRRPPSDLAKPAPHAVGQRQSRHGQSVRNFRRAEAESESRYRGSRRLTGNTPPPRKTKGPGERTEALTPAGNPQPTCNKWASAIPANARTPSIPVDTRASPCPCSTSVLHSLRMTIPGAQHEHHKHPLDR